MSFDYISGQVQTSLTPPARPMYCKSFKIDIAAGSGFTSATEYTLGYLPKGSQPLLGHLIVTTAVSGGTVSAATLTVKANGGQVGATLNVFASATVTMGPTGTYANESWEGTTDQVVTYTPTLTGSGATTGVIYVNIFYVA